MGCLCCLRSPLTHQTTRKVRDPHLSPRHPLRSFRQAVGIVGADPGHPAAAIGPRALRGDDAKGFHQLEDRTT
jgi:hypothetical protein